MPAPPATDSAPAGPLWTLFGLRPFELYSIVALTTTVVFLRSHGLRIDWRTVDYTFRPFLPAALGLLLAGIALQTLYRTAVSWRRRERFAGAVDYLRAIARPRWVGLWLRLYVAYAIAFYCYNWLKVSIPLVNHRLWDQQLFELDRVLHFGISPTVFAVELFGGTPLVGLLDHWYSLWIATVMYSIAFFVTARDANLRAGFLLSCSLLWTLGAWLYMALPALGPIYAFTDNYREIVGELARAPEGHRVLWDNYQTMLSGRTGPLTAFNPTRGIAALPSLHVGAHVLLTLWTRRFARPFYLPFLIASVLTFLGSLITGWHYAVDGYVGALLAFGCYWLALRCERPSPPLASPPVEAKVASATP